MRETRGAGEVLLAGHQANPFPEVAPKGTVKCHSVLQVERARGEGKKGGYRARAGGPDGCEWWETCLHSPRPACSPARNLGAKLHSQSPGSNARRAPAAPPEFLRAHGTEKNHSVSP